MQCSCSVCSLGPVRLDCSRTDGLVVLVGLLSTPFVLLGYLDGVFFFLFLCVLAGFCAAGLFEAEFLVSVGLLSMPFVLLGYLDGVFFFLFLYVLAGFCAAGLFEAEFHVLVGLLSMSFGGSLFFSARSAAVPQCEFRGPFEVKAVGREKAKGTPTSFGSRLGQQRFRGHSSLWREKISIRVAVCCYVSASMLKLFAAEALSMLISLGRSVLFDLLLDMRWSGYISKQQLHGSSSALPCLAAGLVLDMGMFLAFGSGGPCALLR